LSEQVAGAEKQLGDVIAKLNQQPGVIPTKQNPLPTNTARPPGSPLQELTVVTSDGAWECDSCGMDVSRGTPVAVSHEDDIALCQACAATNFSGKRIAWADMDSEPEGTTSLEWGPLTLPPAQLAQAEHITVESTVFDDVMLRQKQRLPSDSARPPELHHPTEDGGCESETSGNACGEEADELYESDASNDGASSASSSGSDDSGTDQATKGEAQASPVEVSPKDILQLTKEQLAGTHPPQFFTNMARFKRGPAWVNPFSMQVWYPDGYTGDLADQEPESR